MRYAGFWPRLAAMLIDTLVLLPLWAITYWGWATSKATALALEVPFSFAFAFYNIYFVGRWGQTIGKMALRVKVVALDGSSAGYTRAFYRHSVDLAFAIVGMILITAALMSVSSSEYDNAPFRDKMKLLTEYMPSWSSAVDWLSFGWVVSELLVLLLNEKRRALHDFIAGTVVVHTKTEVAIAV